MDLKNFFYSFISYHYTSFPNFSSSQAFIFTVNTRPPQALQAFRCTLSIRIAVQESTQAHSHVASFAMLVTARGFMENTKSVPQKKWIFSRAASECKQIGDMTQPWHRSPRYTWISIRQYAEGLRGGTHRPCRGLFKISTALRAIHRRPFLGSDVCRVLSPTNAVSLLRCWLTGQQSHSSWNRGIAIWPHTRERFCNRCSGNETLSGMGKRFSN